jgi:WD40 repeat protein
MVVTKLNTSAALIVSIYLLATGTCRADSPKTEGDKQAKKDYYGDPLPPGVLARMGTVQLRHFQADFVFSPDGKSLISAGGDQNVHTWDVATGKLSKTTKIQRTTREPIHQLTLAPGGQTLAAWERNHAFIYDTSTGKEVQSFPVEEADYAWSTFSADGKMLAIMSRSGGPANLRVWDVEAGKERFSLAPAKSVGRVAFSPDGKRLAVSTSADKLSLVDTADGKELVRITAHGWNLAFSPDGKTLATAAETNEGVKLWDAVTLAAKETIKVEGVRSISGLSFAPDSTLLAFRDEDDLVVWDLNKQKVVQRLKNAGIHGPVFAPNGKILAAQAFGSEIRLWDLATGEPIHRRPGHDHWIFSMAISSDGRIVASASFGDPNVRIWDASSGKPLHTFKAGNRFVRSCAFSPNDKSVVSADADGIIQLWDVAGGKEKRRFVAEPNAKLRHLLDTTPIRFVANGKQIATVCHIVDESADSQVLIWEAATGDLISHRPYHADIRSQATPTGRSGGMRVHANFTPDGKGVTEKVGDGLIIQDTATGRSQVFIPGITGERLAFSSDGRLVAAPAIGKPKEDPFDWNETDGVRLAETLTGKEILHLPTAEINALDFSPDGEVLATADRTAIRFWDVATGKELLKRLWPEAYRDPDLWWPATSLHFLPNGKRLITGMRDGTILVWDVPVEARPAPTKAKELGTKEIDGLCADLADDPPKAYRAIHALCQSPTQASLYFKDYLKPAEGVEPKKLQRLLADLDSDQFDTREKAAKELANLGEQIEPALRKALEGKPSEEVRRRVKELLDLPRAVPSGETLRTLRAIQVLERIGTKEAREVLKKVAAGAEGARETREAKEALERLARLAR